MTSINAADVVRLPHFVKAPTVNPEYWSACPFCGGIPSAQKVSEGRGNEPPDRFHAWPVSDGQFRFWCRKCKRMGFTGGKVDESKTAELLKFVQDQAAEDWAKAQERKKSTIQRLNREKPYLTYHEELNGHTGLLRTRWGIENHTIREFQVGYCSYCPTTPRSDPSDSFTIPYFYKSRCINIEHRLLKESLGRYRPHAAGLGNAIFNVNLLFDTNWVVLVEGAFKVMVLHQNGVPAVGIRGNHGFKEDWAAKFFSEIEHVHVALDPGADEDAFRIARWLKAVVPHVKVARLFLKPDDLFTHAGVTLNEFVGMIEDGVPL